VDALTARLDAMAQERGRPEPGREEVH
jgi:hypothetical protein